METKLKRPASVKFAITFIAVALVYMVVTILEAELFGSYYSSWIWGGIIIVFGFISQRAIGFMPTGIKVVFLGMFILVGTAVWHYELGAHMDSFLSKDSFYIHVGLMGLIILIGFPFMLFYKNRLNVHYRKILELGASGVTGTENGYTSRPFPAGKANFKISEVVHFGRFLGKNHVAVPVLEEKKIILKFSSDTFLASREMEENTSFVSFFDSGEVTVNISRKDYDQFKEQFTFEELCESIARMFLGFLDLFRSGRGKEIIIELESVESRKKKLALTLFSILMFLLFLVSTTLYFMKVLR